MCLENYNKQYTCLPFSANMADVEEHSGREGTARLCIQYEMEMSSSKKKPLSLFDALDNSEPRPEGEDDVVGEERVNAKSLQPFALS